MNICVSSKLKYKNQMVLFISLNSSSLHQFHSCFSHLQSLLQVHSVHDHSLFMTSNLLGLITENSYFSFHLHLLLSFWYLFFSLQLQYLSGLVKSNLSSFKVLPQFLQMYQLQLYSLLYKALPIIQTFSYDALNLIH